ncbi:MAG: response regulator [Alphaproteobacteria bacterium]
MATAISPRKREAILLVEDQPSNVLVTSAVLDMMGYACDVAVSGDEALKKFMGKNYALIIMDVQLPGIDGLETTRWIRQIENERNLKPTPIVAMTSNATMDDRLFCLRAGMNDYMSKPFDSKQLSLKIQELTGQASAAA